MKFAMEIPIPHLKQLSEHTDYDFALTHKVLQSGVRGKYTQFYKKQAKLGREVWLDNSFHELGYSVSANEISRAADMIMATHLVAPEVENDARATEKAIEDFRVQVASHYRLIGTWWGYTKDLKRLDSIADVVALPWRKNRSRYLTGNELEHLNSEKPYSRHYHYFGFKTLDELRNYPPASLDTSMPIRAALQGIDLNIRERRPKTQMLNYEDKLTKAVLKLTLKNIKLLKKAADGGE